MLHKDLYLFSDAHFKKFPNHIMDYKDIVVFNENDESSVENDLKLFLWNKTKLKRTIKIEELDW